jgi:hypothetical protein
MKRIIGTFVLVDLVILTVIALGQIEQTASTNFSG